MKTVQTLEVICHYTDGECTHITVNGKEFRKGDEWYKLYFSHPIKKIG